ncbi:MAG: NUDIX domain-containing protein [Candidatus Neomarinimicrobiota bacterium]
MPKTVIRVIDAYVFRQTADGLRFLLLQRNVNKIYEHLWQGVAGKIETGEAAWQTAVRELQEETGLTPKRLFTADHVSSFYEAHGDRINLIPVFGIEVDSEEVVLSGEHSGYRWVDLETALQLLVWRGQRNGLKAVYDMIVSGDERMRWSEIDLPI